MKEFFFTTIIKPIYNILILLIDFLTTDLGIAIVILTILIRLILFPLYKSQIKNQIRMKEIQEPLKEIKEKYKNDREKMGRAMMEIYKKYEINPFSGILILIIQLPVLIGLYYVFSSTGLPEINESLKYNFVVHPENISTMFLGLIDVTEKSVILAVLASITQFIQLKLISFSFRKDKNSKDKKTKDGSMEEVMQNVQNQMTYTMPILVLFISFSFGAIIALYFLVGNIFSIFQEIYIRKNIREPEEKKIKEIKI